MATRRRAASPRKKAPALWLKGQKERLESDREDLRREIEIEARLLKVTGTSHPREEADLAEEAREDEEAARTMAVLEERLRAVEEALRRVGRGTYGLCADCRKPILRVRLRAVPFAIRCAPCQAAREKGKG